MWKIARIAWGNTIKRGNKKSGECITPIRYNVIHMHVLIPEVAFCLGAFPGKSKLINTGLLLCWVKQFIFDHLSHETVDSLYSRLGAVGGKSNNITCAHIVNTGGDYNNYSQASNLIVHVQAKLGHRDSIS